jgi:putative hydrolase of the HAD superfamily
MGKTDAVIFDLYNTLLDNKTDEERQNTYEFLSLWLSYHGVWIKPVALRRLYLDLCHQEMSKCVGDFPDIEIGNVFSAILALPGGPPVPALLVAQLALLFRIWTTDRLSPFPGAIPLLAALKGRVKLAIASNAQRLFTLPELARFGMGAYFDAVVFSSDLGVCKPDPRLFHAALDALSVPPQRAIFVGDNPEADIRGAQGVGMKAVWVNRGGAVEKGSEADYVVADESSLTELLLSML